MTPPTRPDRSRRPRALCWSVRPGASVGWLSLGFGGLLLAAAWIPGGPCLHAAATPASEYKLKAAFLFNFAKFVEWPPESFATPDAPIRFGILGSNPFGSDLQESLKDRQISGRSLEILNCRNAEEARSCQLVFISQADDRDAAVVRALHGLHVLTVGETERFQGEGGIITLLMEAGKVRFEINLEAARAAGLKLNGQLLRLARKVTPPAP